MGFRVAAYYFWQLYGLPEFALAANRPLPRFANFRECNFPQFQRIRLRRVR